MPEVCVTLIYVQPTHDFREFDIVQMPCLLERTAKVWFRAPTC